LIAAFLKHQSGATAIEYGLIAPLIAIVCVAPFVSTGSSLSSVFISVKAELDTKKR
jgi:pilus assembly protein Flp/PilA